MNSILFYIAGGLTLIWGVAHLFPTKNVVKGFGEISEDNRRIITMEWIIEGLTLIFIGALTITATLMGPDCVLAPVVYGGAVIMLLVLAVLSLFTGFNVNFLPFKLCPFIFSLSAILILFGMLL